MLNSRHILLMLVAAGLVCCSLLSLRQGVVTLPWTALITGWQAADSHHFILVGYRLPRLILAIFVGAALGISGVLVQAIIRNPLASPDILGVNHAASLVTISGLLLLPALPVYSLPLLAFVGGMAGLWFLRLLARRAPPMRLALTGVALSACWASLTNYLMLSRPQDVNSALLWLTGSLWGRDSTFVETAVPVLLVLLPLALYFCRDLDLLALGDQQAASLGVNVSRLSTQVLVLAVALAATGVAVCGPISFISLVIPHMMRKLTGGRHRGLLQASALAGALLLVVADLLARTLHPPLELPAGLLTAVIGAPWFIWLLMRMR